MGPDILTSRRANAAASRLADTTNQNKNIKQTAPRRAKKETPPNTATIDI